MLTLERKIYFWKIKEIWFSDRPADITGCDRLVFRACKNKLDMPGFDRHDFSTTVIDLNQDLDKIWQDMSKSSCRNVISRAQEMGIEINVNKYREDFYKINKDFRKKKGLSVGDSSSANFIKNNGTLFTARFSGKIIAGALFLEDANNIRWFLGASKRFDKDAVRLSGYANRLIIWEAIKYAKNKGIKEFDTGGYYIGKKFDKEKLGISAFKKSFGGRLEEHYIYTKNYSKFFKFLHYLGRI